jgi:hypothetical protein
LIMNFYFNYLQIQKRDAMLQSISWSEYFSLLAVLFVLYYLLILYVYFKWDILKKIGITKVDPGNVSAAIIEPMLFHSAERNRDHHDHDSAETDLSPIIQSYTDEVKAFLEEAGENQIVKEEILFALQQISARYRIVYQADTKEGVVQEIYRLTVRQFPNLVTIKEIRPYLFS